MCGLSLWTFAHSQCRILQPYYSLARIRGCSVLLSLDGVSFMRCDSSYCETRAQGTSTQPYLRCPWTSASHIIWGLVGTNMPGIVRRILYLRIATVHLPWATSLNCFVGCLSGFHGDWYIPGCLLLYTIYTHHAPNPVGFSVWCMVNYLYPRPTATLLQAA